VLLETARLKHIRWCSSAVSDWFEWPSEHEK